MSFSASSTRFNARDVIHLGIDWFEIVNSLCKSLRMRSFMAVVEYLMCGFHINRSL